MPDISNSCTPLIGVVDSGVSPQQQVTCSSAFVIQQGSLWQAEAEFDTTGHGSRVVEIIQTLAPQARIASANIFQGSPGTSVLQVAAAIDWLVEQQVVLINLSLGLTRDSTLLREACNRAVSQGVLLCASTPAQGGPVYPAAYPGVLRATGDARCDHKDLSHLGTPQADFAGCVNAMSGRSGGAGASMGCAHISGHLARYFTENPRDKHEQALSWLAREARWQGREYRAKAHG